jgi:hypothetical protein
MIIPDLTMPESECVRFGARGLGGIFDFLISDSGCVI